MKEFNWAFIGSGHIAKKVARSITKNDNQNLQHNICSVYSRNKGTAKIFADKYNASFCDSFDEAINKDNVDCVYIATPQSTHYQYIKKVYVQENPFFAKNQLHDKKPFEKKENAETKEITESVTDPESGLYVKGEHKRQFAYEAHMACDKHGFVLETEVTPGNVHDSVAFDKVYDKLTEKFPEVEIIVADSAYNSLTTLMCLKRREWAKAEHKE